MTRHYLTQAEAGAAVAGLLEDWRNQAACKGRSHLMDPVAGHTSDTATAAKAICHGCPVFDRCFDWVLTIPTPADPGGICAGLTEIQRAHRRNHRRLHPSTPVPPGSKRCTRCRTVRPVTEFYRNAAAADGYKSACIPCHRGPE